MIPKNYYVLFFLSASIIILVEHNFATQYSGVCTLGFDRDKQVTENKSWFTHLEQIFFTFVFTFTYFEDFQISTKIYYNPYFLYKILKVSKFCSGEYQHMSSEF